MYWFYETWLENLHSYYAHILDENSSSNSSLFLFFRMPISAINFYRLDVMIYV